MRWHAPGALLRGDVLAGLMFVAVGALGLFLSRHYPVGTALRMGTGYMPRLLCWILLVLGLLVAAQALVFSRAPPLALQWSGWRPLLFVTLAVLVFGFTIERLGVVAATAFLVLVGAFARRGLRPLEIVATAFLLVVFTVGIFVWGLGLTLDVWPEW
ncbi:MAG: tripartite tricarboxylate transporter TctB family protein [Proteobacteria bacterium]|nr:tripartite tricarboxylate transporter TctB family protein [Pseudomonadota bacterium]